MGAKKQHLLFCSPFPYFKVVANVLEAMASSYDFKISMIGPKNFDNLQVSFDSDKSLDFWNQRPGFVIPTHHDERYADVELVPLLSPGKPWSGFAPDAFHSALRKLHPDVIWAYPEPTCPSTLQILSHYFFCRKPKIVCSVFENIFAQPSLYHRLRISFLFRRLDALLSASTSSSIGLSKSYWFSKNKSYTTFISNLDPDFDRVDSCSINRLPGDTWVGFVGRISSEKGWDDFLNMLSHLPKHVKGVIVGDGPEFQLMQDKIESLSLNDRIWSTGVLDPDRIHSLYSQLAVLVVPSKSTPTWKEQFGRVIAEAMAASIPVVGYDSGSISEVIGDAGFVVPEGDVDGLCHAVQRLVENDLQREQLGSSARQRFEDEFSVDSYIQKTIRIFEKI